MIFSQHSSWVLDLELAFSSVSGSFEVQLAFPLKICRYISCPWYILELYSWGQGNQLRQQLLLSQSARALQSLECTHLQGLPIASLLKNNMTIIKVKELLLLHLKSMVTSYSHPPSYSLPILSKIIKEHYNLKTPQSSCFTPGRIWVWTPSPSPWM